MFGLRSNFLPLSQFCIKVGVGLQSGFLSAKNEVASLHTDAADVLT